MLPHRICWILVKSSPKILQLRPASRPYVGSVREAKLCRLVFIVAKRVLMVLRAAKTPPADVLSILFLAV